MRRLFANSVWESGFPAKIGHRVFRRANLVIGSRVMN